MPMMTTEAIEALSKGAELAGRDKERERCAKIAERPRIQDAMIGEVGISADAREIAAEIRKTEE